MTNEPKPEVPAESASPRRNPAEARKSPPEVYFPACGVLCDVLWWARRKDDPPVEE